MNVKTTIATLSVLSALSFGAFAADSINAEQAANLQPVGTISVSGVDGDQTNIRQELSQKADAQAASHYRIIENNQDNTFHVTAELYK